jgi:hypothetical protein
MAAEIWDQFECIEECYEFMLAYAARGITSEDGSEHGSQLRTFLQRAVEALGGLPGSCEAAVRQQGQTPADRFSAFLSVLDRDAADSLAAMELVLAQPSITSQLIDNLNASMHLRALLTDIFLLGEVLRTQRIAANQTAGAGASPQR